VGLSFCGEKRDARAALYGGRCGFSGLAEGTRPCEGDLLYRPISYEVISEPRRRPMEGGIG
jgi:hypothetical protein